jgi:hypothetical protein
LKVNDENSRIRIKDPDPNPLVRGMDPRIRIHPKMSWIRNTALMDSYFTYNTGRYRYSVEHILGIVHTILCLGFCLVGVGLMWTWSLFLHWSRIDEFVLGLKSKDELCHSPPKGTGSADTSQPPKGEICKDKSH